MVVYDDTSNEPVRIFDSGRRSPIRRASASSGSRYRTGDIVSPKIDATEPLALELVDFCSVDRRRARRRVRRPELGLEVVRTIDAVDRSLERGGAPIRFSDRRTDAGSSTEEPVATAPAVAEPTLGHARQALRPTATGKRPPGREDSSSIGYAVLGAGPAGLTAAWTSSPSAASRARSSRPRERSAESRRPSRSRATASTSAATASSRSSKPVERLWEDMLGDEFLARPRLSRIYYNGQFFDYPLTANDVLRRLGVVESALCALSYLWSMRHRRREAETFEEWVTIRFGRRLYDAFFRTYTEKVWGIPGSEIRAQWAAQRIKNFSLGKAVLSLLGLSRDHVTTLIEEFRYPRLGPGQMWEDVPGAAGGAWLARPARAPLLCRSGTTGRESRASSSARTATSRSMPWTASSPASRCRISC